MRGRHDRGICALCDAVLLPDAYLPVTFPHCQAPPKGGSFLSDGVHYAECESPAE